MKCYYLPDMNVCYDLKSFFMSIPTHGWGLCSIYCRFDSICNQRHTGPEVIQTTFMLNLAEHEILNALKYKNILKNQPFSGSDTPRMLFSCS